MAELGMPMRAKPLSLGSLWLKGATQYVVVDVLRGEVFFKPLVGGKPRRGPAQYMTAPEFVMAFDPVAP